jgi:hypothetical protein
MTSRTKLLVAAVAAAGWGLTPLAYGQLQEPQTPSANPQDTMPDDSMHEQQDPGMDPDMNDPSAMPPASPGASADASSIDDRKIEQFADAYLAVQTIQQKAAADMQTASDPAQADKVKSDAESQMIAAVERSGLQVDEFNRIVETMASDVNVRSRVAAKLQERSPGP